jgi:hypothetical protein
LSLGLGKAILASDTEVHRELRGLGAGLELIHGESPWELRESIQGILGVPSRLAALEAASAGYARRYGPEGYARQVGDLYRKAFRG